jgi:hypothetical protein
MRSIVSSSLVVIAALGLAHAAIAQQAAASEVDYCRTLARAYLSQNPVQATPNVEDATLADSCATYTQGTTALLKQKLASHGIDLPKPTMAGAGQ